MKRWTSLMCGLALIAGLGAGSAVAQVATPPPVVATPPVATPPGSAPGPAQEYILGPEDVVEVEVVGTADRTRARIYTDGTIQMNLIGTVPASGKTPRQLSADIAKLLKAGSYYADPVVNVEIVGFASRYVTVLGAVGTPGLVPINRPYRLSEILARVGGVKDGGADYVIVRSEGREERRFNVDQISSGAIDDPSIQAGDKIFSPTAELFYINGQVNAPGAYPLKSGMTIAQAIAKGGGLTESGSGKKVKVHRGDKDIKLGSNDKIEAGDVLTVSERLF